MVMCRHGYLETWRYENTKIEWLGDLETRRHGHMKILVYESCEKSTYIAVYSAVSQSQFSHEICLKLVLLKWSNII